MRIGAMNHPMRDVVAEIRSFREMGFDFIDLTLEPGRASPGRIDVRAVREALAESGLGTVGHTAWFLPIASAFDRLREAALEEMVHCLDVFAEIGVRLVNLHPDQRVPLHDRDWVIERNVDAIRRLVELAAERDIRIMAENVPGVFNSEDVLRRLFSAVPDLLWHLDVGHANLGSPSNTTDSLLAAFRERLAHVHLSDNKGGDADLHLPLGAGLIDWQWVVSTLKQHRYDGTITLEVFSPDHDYLMMSRQKLRRLWDSTVA